MSLSCVELMIIKLQLLSIVDLYRFKSEFYTRNESFLIVSNTPLLERFTIEIGDFLPLCCILLEGVPLVVIAPNMDINVLVSGLALWSPWGLPRVGLGLMAIDVSVLVLGLCLTCVYLGSAAIDDLVLFLRAICDLVLDWCGTALLVSARAVVSHHVTAFFIPCAARALSVLTLVARVG